MFIVKTEYLKINIKTRWFFASSPPLEVMEVTIRSCTSIIKLVRLNPQDKWFFFWVITQLEHLLKKKSKLTVIVVKTNKQSQQQVKRKPTKTKSLQPRKWNWPPNSQIEARNLRIFPRNKSESNNKLLEKSIKIPSPKPPSLISILAVTIQPWTK